MPGIPKGENKNTMIGPAGQAKIFGQYFYFR